MTAVAQRVAEIVLSIGPGFAIVFGFLIFAMTEVVVERVLVLWACRSRRRSSPWSDTELRGRLGIRTPAEARTIVRDHDGLGARLLFLALRADAEAKSVRGTDGDVGPAERVSRAVDAVATGPIETCLFSQLRYLHLIARVAPLVGLLGTVVGLLELFETLGVRATGDIEALLGTGLSKALWTTVIGLIVAIIALLAAEVLEDLGEAALGRARIECERLLRDAGAEGAAGASAAPASTSPPSST